MKTTTTNATTSATARAMSARRATASHIRLQAHKIMRTADGSRVVKFADGSSIPADIAGLCAGPDKWISEITCKCRDCGEVFPLRELQGGGQWCEECQTAGIED
jgi:hypothetical protein